MKQVVWLGDSLDRVRAFDPAARRSVGQELGLVQAGGSPVDWKPMPSIGPGVNEIRVHAGGAHRLIYVAKFAEAVYVLHAFRKKSSKTARTDADLARARLRRLMHDRRIRWPRD